MRAAPPERAKALFDDRIRMVREISGVPVATGVFGASMQVEWVNDGPVTIFPEGQSSRPFGFP